VVLLPHKRRTGPRGHVWLIRDGGPFGRVLREPVVGGPLAGLAGIGQQSRIRVRTVDAGEKAAAADTVPVRATVGAIRTARAKSQAHGLAARHPGARRMAERLWHAAFHRSDNGITCRSAAGGHPRTARGAVAAPQLPLQVSKQFITPQRRGEHNQILCIGAKFAACGLAQRQAASGERAALT